MKREKYKISIIMPAYNIANEISRSIESVLAQTYKNIELIIIDDGSSDETPQILDDYAKNNERIIVFHRQNGGVFSARLEGVALSTGDYIGFVDGDDVVEEEMFETLLYNAIKYSADISHCGYQMVFPKGKIDYYYATGKKVIQDTRTGIVDLISGKFVEPGVWNKLYARKLFNYISHLEFDYSIKINEDLLLNYYLFKYSTCSIYEDICFYHYMIRKNSASTSCITSNKLCDPIKVLKIIVDDVGVGYSDYGIVLSQLVRKYIAALAINYKIDRKLIIPIQKKLQLELKSILKIFFWDSSCSIKLKILAAWVTLIPRSYQIVHLAYEKITGIDKKYSVE